MPLTPFFCDRKGPYMLNRRLAVLPIMVFALLAASVCLWAKDTPTRKIDPLDLKNIMLVKDVKPGMKGYGKTVFRGTKIETFEVEVISVMEKMNFGKSLILVTMKGGPITERGANLIQGMSGSPVYINGKLIGAFAYGEAFIKEPIGMVTPIEDMLDAWDPSLPSKPSTFFPLGTADLDKPIPLAGRVFSKVAIDDGKGRDYGSGTLVFRPLAVPFTVRGMSPHIISMLADRLKPLNIVPVAGPGTPADKADMDIELEPGAAVGVSLATGDLDITGVGTVTYRRGNRILAFGHPMISNPFMNGMGAIDAAMTTAYVHDVFPSIMISSKVASPIRTVGRVFQDRPWSIAGEIGAGPKMIPVTIHIDDKSLGRKRDFNVQVLNHPLFASSLIVGATSEAIFEMRGSPDDATAKVRTEVVAEEIGSIVRENIFFDPVMIDMAATGDLQQILMMLEYNRFYPVGVKKVDVSVEIVPKHQTAQIQRIFLKESKFEPGETVDVGVVLKPFKSDPITKMVSIQLPKDIPPGRMPLQVRGMAGMGGPMAMMDTQQMDQEGSAPGGPAPTVENVQQLIKKFLQREKNNELVAKVLLPKSAITISGEKLSGLPPTISDAMRSAKATMLGSEREEVKVVVPTEWVLTGQQQLMITVEKKSKVEKSTPGSGGSGPSMAPPESGPEEESAGEESGPEGMSLLPLDLTRLNAATDTVMLAKVETPTASASAPSKPSAGSDESAAKDKASGEEKKPDAPKADEKAIGRAPTVWKQTSRTEFSLGTMENTSATTKDALILAGSLKPLYESPETYVWCVLPDGNGNVYAGTGNRGIIYKVAADGKASTFYDTTELEIHSLARDSKGNVYAGTSPNGMVYKITPAGVGTTLLDADEKYIVALATDTKGNVYAATGDKCKVYKITPDGKTDVIIDSSESYALSLAADKDDNVYVGTGQNGILYKITPDGKTQVLYDAAEPSISALTVDSEGSLYAGTAPKGVVYKLSPGATPKVAFDKAGTSILALTASKDGCIYAANTNTIFRLMEDDTVCALQNSQDLQFLCLASADGKVYAGTGNIGSIYAAPAGVAMQGTYESPVRDCQLSSKWGMISWTADVPKGTSLTLQTRTGDVAEPDSSWSAWSLPYTASGAKIASPPGRYVQYLATLKTDDPSATPVLKDVSIVYLTKNQAPKVTLTSPKGGEKWARTKTIKWTGADPDKDTLTYEVFYSDDNGQTWKPLTNSVKPAAEPKPNEGSDSAEEETPAEEQEAAPENEPAGNGPMSAEEAMAQMAAELDKHPEMPQEVKDKIMAEAAQMIEQEEKAAGPTAPRESAPKADARPAEKPANNGTKSTSSNWDTTKYADGVYLVKVVASDRISNPTDALTAEAISEPIVLSNKAPRVSAFKKTITIQSDNSARIEGVAYHDFVGLAGVQYKVDADDWAAAAATDGIFDSKFETFVITTQPLSKGDHIMEVKAVDQAGNAATTKVTVKVE